MKIYKIGKYEVTGDTLWNALTESYNRYNHPLIDKWIKDQAEIYLSKEYDGEAIFNLLFDFRLIRIIDLLQMKGYDLEDYELNLNRDDIDKFITEYSNDETVKNAFIKLKELFNEDLNGKRAERAWEKASDDFYCFLSDIDKDNDEQLAKFFGCECKHIGWKIDREEYALDDVEICANCKELVILETIDLAYKENYDGERPHDTFCCPHCCVEYKYDIDHMKINMHNEKMILLKMI